MRRILAAAMIAAMAACAPGPEAEVAQAPPPAPAREIAFTFDDSPTPDSHSMTGAERTRRLIAALEAAEIPGAMIFAVGQNAAGDGRARLEAFAAAGLVIANHSNTHSSGNALSAEAFIADVQAADASLRTLPGFQPYFRFPYLHAGDTEEKRDAYRAALSEMGYRHGYVTVDAWDWYMAGKVDEAVAAGRDLDWDAVREVYVDVVARSAAHYDSVARRYLGRSPRHVLLMHENDLAAMFIGDVAARLRAEGWTIIPAVAAFADPIAAVEPDTLYLGGGQLTALAYAAGAPPEALDSGLTNEAALDALLAPVLDGR